VGSSPKTWPASVQGLKLITQIAKFQLSGTLPRRREGRANQQRAAESPWEPLLSFHVHPLPSSQYIRTNEVWLQRQGVWSVLGSWLPVSRAENL
jgi:membrane protein YqaA with SNARE-associated domain